MTPRRTRRLMHTLLSRIASFVGVGLGSLGGRGSRPPKFRRETAALVLALCAWTAAARGQAQSPIEVNEWSIWVGNPTLTNLNAAKVYRNPMPSFVGTSRPKFDEKETAGKFPIAPVSLIQFFGGPTRDVDVDLRIKKGTFLGHWPPGKPYPNRITWFGSELTAERPADAPPSRLTEEDWLRAASDNADALFLKYETRAERFVAYDAELALPVPLRIRGGPDEYSLQNLTSRKLVDVAVIAPADDGFRVGWLDELPSGAAEGESEKAGDDAAKPADSKDDANPKEKAEDLFRQAEEKPATEKKDEPLPPLPAEADATIRARVDQLLNQPITLGAEQAPRRDLIGMAAQQARLRVEFDEPALAKEKIDLSKPAELKAAGIAARDALAELLGSAGLSYRVTEEGRLFVTTSARLAAEADKKGDAIEGPPVKLVMSQPRKPSDPSYGELTRDALTRRLEAQGLRKDVVQRVVDHHVPALFEPGELIVLAFLTREAIDEAVPLDIFPPPKSLARVALVVVHGVDPRLQDRARALVKQLGDPSWRNRESAESTLLGLGSVAVPALEDALRDPDVEIVSRVERLLLKLNRPVP